MKHVISKLMMLSILLLSIPAFAEVQPLFNYQGRLVASDGTPYQGTRSITLSIYNVESSGTALRSAVYQRELKNGYFNIQFGAEAGMDLSTLPFNEQYYLGVRVEGDASEMTPREKLASVAYSMRAQTAVQAESATIAATALHANTTTSADNGVPAGAVIMILSGLNCPTGYSRVTSLDSRFPRGAGSGLPAGGTGGSDSHGHANITGSGGVDHSHSYSFTTSQPTDTENTSSGGQAVAGQWHTHTFSGSTLGATSYSHTHSIAVDSNVPGYFNVIFCEKQ